MRVTFSRAEWIQFNADYPGFERLVIEELVAEEDAAVRRSPITGRVDGRAKHFECASFARLQDGRILTLTEVWTDVEQQSPPGTRLGAAD